MLTVSRSHVHTFPLMFPHKCALSDLCLLFTNQLHVTQLHFCVCLTGLRLLTCAFFMCVAVKDQKPIKTKFRMPVFNWGGTEAQSDQRPCVHEIDDERILEVRQTRFENIEK